MPTSLCELTLFTQPSEVTAAFIFNPSFLKSISSSYTWQIPSNRCAEHMILSQISHRFRASLLRCSHSFADDLLSCRFSPLGLFLVRVSSSSWVGRVRVIFSRAVTWCQCKWSLTAVGYWYMLQIHSSQPGTKDSCRFTCIHFDFWKRPLRCLNWSVLRVFREKFFKSQTHSGSFNHCVIPAAAPCPMTKKK